jgi:hypothetical protein
VHVSRLASHVLWTPPRVDPSDPFESNQHRPSDPVRRHGGVAIRVEDWEARRRQFDGLPAAGEFPQTVRRDLLAAWRADAEIFGQLDSPDHLVELARTRAVAADPSTLDDALAQLERVAGWLRADLDAVVGGALVSASSGDAAVETIYLDVPDTFDPGVLREWRPTGRVRGQIIAVFGGELVLVPPPA